MSNSDVVIRVEGLGKSYALHHEQAESYTALRDVVARQARAAGRLLNPFTLAGQLRKAQREAAKAGEEEFWALKDVSFKIRRGERVGIIGRNGAGKSTLLKILSRITEPTTGRVEICGRVASLLEVGTGFHPELTGRENIYLNGSILGMTRREIRAKFDEIVDFAEVERFLDTPVKRYSSGMYVRLAFAVAAHLEPEILVVDEVLAVGDANFQKKCLGKLEEVSDTSDRTVLFVSHNLAALSSLCTSGLLINKGQIERFPQCREAIRKYQALGLSNSEASLIERRDRKGTQEFRFTKIDIYSQQKGAHLTSGLDAKISIAIENESGKDYSGVEISVGIVDLNETPLLLLKSNFYNKYYEIRPGLNIISCTLPNLPLADGDYQVNLFCSTQLSVVDWIERAATFTVLAGDFFGSGSKGLPQNCKILHCHKWS